MKSPTCSCGRQARVFVDVHSPGARLPACSKDCQALGEGDLDVVVNEADFPKVLAARPCWCKLRRYWRIPFCPAHGPAK